MSIEGITIHACREAAEDLAVGCLIYRNGGAGEHGGLHRLVERTNLGSMVRLTLQSEHTGENDEIVTGAEHEFKVIS